MQDKLTFLKHEKPVSLCKGLYSLQHLTVNQIDICVLLDKIQSVFLVNPTNNNLISGLLLLTIRRVLGKQLS